MSRGRGAAAGWAFILVVLVFLYAPLIPPAINSFSGASQFTAPTGQIAAAAIVVTVPIVIMVLIFQRRIVAGLTAGAVK